MISPLFRPVDFADLPGWTEDSIAAALAAFRRSAFQALVKPWQTGSLGVDFDGFAAAFAEARETAEPDQSTARDFFERHFRPCRVLPGEGRHGFVTGFYEPELDASPVPTETFTIPLHAPPADLVEIDDANRPAGFDPSYAFGRATPAGVVEYFDRRAIEQGAIEGRSEALAWLADRVDAFFVHVQGAARLRFPDGTVRRVTYAAKSGHPFTGPGKILAELGAIPRKDVTMQSIRAWFRDNPDRIDEILWRNRSYIFFREAQVDDPTLGPVAAAKVPLTPGRSLAVDRLLHTFATPFFVDAPELRAFGDKPFRRLMIAQDTGSAIVGSARGDLFAGSGDAAGDIAGIVKHDADFYALLPRSLTGEMSA